MKKFLLFIFVKMLFGSYIFASTIDIRISQSSDDAEQRSDNSMYLTSSDLELVKDDGIQIIGLRFQNLDIPKDAVITNAYLQFTVDETTSETTNLSIYGESSDNAETFIDEDNDISDRLKTSNHIPWSVSNWNNSGETGVKQRTPNLKDIVQDIVNRSGFTSGNSIAFIIEGSGERVAESYDGDSSQAPHLHIEYESDVNVVTSRVLDNNDDAEQSSSGAVNLSSSDLELVQEGSTQTIGIRFQNLNIPQNSNIKKAYLQFTVDEDTDEDTNLVIHGENSDNTISFSTNNSNISNRTKTSNSTSWNVPEWMDVGESGLDQRTPDLKDVVQEIVDRGGWSSGNAMSFIISGSGKRVAESRNSGSSTAPLLYIEYENNASNEEVNIPTCYMMTDNTNAIYTVNPDSRNPSFLPSTTEQEISRTFKSEGNAYRAKDGLVYAFDSEDSEDTNVSIYSINPVDGNTTLVKENLFYGTVEAAEFYIDANTGNEILYLLSHEYNTQLFAFEPQNNWQVVEGYPKDVSNDTNILSSLAINPRVGNAYAMTDNKRDGEAPKLYSIDLQTGATNFLTSLSKIIDAEGLAFGSDNKIYVEDERDGRKLYVVNPSTGAVTPAANLGGDGDFEAISCDGGKEYDFLSIADASEIFEGNAGQKEMKFVVSLNNIATEDISFKYSISNLNTDSSDYVAHTPNSLLTIGEGEKSVEITVMITGDTLLESDEEFRVSLSDVTNAILVDANATGKIINDDILPTVSIADKVCEERGECFFVVSLNSSYVEDIYVDYTTEDASAKIADNDYDYKSGTVKIDAGEINATIKIAITDDETPEYDEMFNIILSHARVETGNYSESMYEDGNDGVSKWSNLNYLGDNGAVVNVSDTIKITNDNCTNACPHDGLGCTQGYKLLKNNSDWANSTQFFASWDMRADEYSEIFFELQTRDNGVVYLTYTKELIVDKEDDGTPYNCSEDTLFTFKADHGGTWWEQPNDTITNWGNYKYFSMGESFEDDEWHHYKRDLKDDYKTLFPTDEILNVKKLYARVYNNGSLYIDNVKLSSHRELTITDKSAVGTIINNDFQEPFVCTDATLYLSNKYLLGSDNSSGSENNSMYLHWIDRTNSPFSYPAIGDESKMQYNALGYNVSDNFLYALYEENLLRIGKNGKIFDRGPVHGLPAGIQQYAGTFDGDGNYLVSDWSDNSKIYKIDIDTLVVEETISMSFSINAYDDMVFVGDKLYASSYPSSNDKYTLWHIDLDNNTYINAGLEQDAGDKIEILYSDGDTLYGVFRNGGLYEISTVTGMRNYVSDSPELANLNDGANCQDTEIKFTDFGDAPIEYGEAGHLIINDLKFGSLVDHESGSQFSPNADGDGVDEDSIDVTELPVLTDMSKTFTIKDIPVVNHTGAGAVLSAWIDFDRDGSFENDEKVEKYVQNGLVTLKWSNITDDTQAGDTYLRVRLSPNSIDSKDSDFDLANINHQQGEVEDYKIVIQESTMLNAWDVDAEENNRVIKTKKVNEDIVLKVASLKKDGSIVESVLSDIKVQLMSQSDNEILTDLVDVNFSLGNPYQINFGKIGTSHKNTYVKFVYKDENNETMESNATDEFAIRPDRYTISTPEPLMAGKEFDITIEAVDVDGEVVSNYEELKVVYDLKHAEVHTNVDCSAKGLDVNKIDFTNGQAVIKATYDEVGRLKLGIMEFKTGGEFASVDYADSGNGRFISDGNTTSSEFAIGKITLESSFGNSNDYIFYADDLDDDSARLYMGVTALNYKDEKVERFTDGCYAKDVNVVVDFDTTHTTNLAANVAYVNTVTANISLNIDHNSFSPVVSSQLFNEGEGNQTVRLNFDRSSTLALDPMKMTVTNLSASIVGGTAVTDSEDKEVTFIYAKAHAPDQSVVGKELNARVGYEVYVPSSMSKADFGFGGLSESPAYANWYVLPADLRFGFTNEVLKYSGKATIQGFLVDRYAIPIVTTSTPHKNRVFYKPRDYLLHDRFGTGAGTHNFVVHLLSDKAIWSGKGKEGKKIANEASNKGLLKMDW